MIDPRIKYYPVGNGDTSLITLSDETKILIDINITNDSIDEEEKDRYDVLRDLLDIELKRLNNKPFVDVFILTHPDNDHCRGFETYFYQGDPNDYSESDKENELIIINELWFTPRIFEVNIDELNSDAEIFKNEAQRRIDLYIKDPNKANINGNRIRIVGYTDNEKLENVEDRIIVPGNSISVFNNSEKKDFSLFIHAPFSDNIDGDDANETSIVFKARFDVDSVKNACLAFWGGDATWRIWEKIFEKSNDNDLSWDLFLAPHHCSWTFFNDNTDDGKKTVKTSSLDILNKKLGIMPKVIVSSKEIKRNDDNPPSYKAKNQYIKIVGEDNFWVTSTHSETTPPVPIEFEIKSTGPQEVIDRISTSLFVSNLIANAVNQPRTYGESI